MNIEKKIHRKVGEALRKYGMIENGDRLLIGVSGGKDSLVVSKILSEKKKYLPISFELEACHIVHDLSEMDEQREKRLFELYDSFEIPIYRRETPVAGRIDPGRPMNCFFCAMQRRIELRKTALERGCNKIVLGHHLDDIIETLLMNMFYKAEISTMPACLEMDNHDLTIIRPLASTKERLIRIYAERLEYGELAQYCPYGKDGRRARVKRLLTELSQEDERIRDNLFASLGRVKLGYLDVKRRDDSFENEEHNASLKLGKDEGEMR